MPTTTARTGMAVDFIPTLIPAMMTVAGPVSPDFEISLVGLYDCEVKYSVA